MVTYGVRFFPVEGTSPQEVDALLARIKALEGVIPGLTKVEIPPTSCDPTDTSRDYSMFFDTDAHMHLYTSHPAYQALRADLLRISPQTTVSAIMIKARIDPQHPREQE